jgi:hypothetical protein
MTDTVATHLADLQRWTGLVLFDVVLKDGTPRYWSTQAITWGGNSYLPVIASHSPITPSGGNVWGVDQLTQIALSLSNADLSLNSIIGPSNIQGGTIQPRFIFVNPANGTTTSDAIVYPVFVFDLPTNTWPTVEVTANNKWNLARRSLPISTISNVDRYPFPSTAAERAAAGSDPTSIFYPCGYDPDNGKGNYAYNVGGVHGYYVGVAQGDPHEVVYDGTRTMSSQIGLSLRWGGQSNVPAAEFQFRPKKGAPVVQLMWTAGAAMFGQAVPRAYGVVRAKGILLDTTASPNGANWFGCRLSHFLLCDGVNFAANEGDYGCQLESLPTFRAMVYLTGVGAAQGQLYNVPGGALNTDPGAQGSFALHSGYLGNQRMPASGKYRNINTASDYPIPDLVGRDMYSGLCFIDVGIPSNLAQPSDATGPGCEVVFQGQKVETLNSDLSSTWKYSQNPVWIFVDLMKLAGWTWDDIDKQAAYNAAAYCDVAVANGLPRFFAGLYLDPAYRASDVFGGLRNCCRMYTSVGSDGKTLLKIEGTEADEGGTVFALDSTNIMRDSSGQTLVRKYHKTIDQISNSWVIKFQDWTEDCASSSYPYRHIGSINRIKQEIDGTSGFPCMGCPTQEQASRLLQWHAYEEVDANEYYEVTVSQGLMTIGIGTLGTITEPRLGLSGQLVRLREITPNADGSLVWTLQIHADAAYSDLPGIAPVARARSDVTYSPRSIANLTAEELFIQDEVNPDSYARKIELNFFVPPTTFAQGFSSQTQISDPSVATTGGTIPGNRTLYVEVCPRISGVDGLPCDWLQIDIPTGTNTNEFTFSLQLPAEADAYTVRIGTHPGACYKHSRVSHSGTTPFTVTITSIAALDQTDLSPDPWFDHVHAFAYFSSMPNTIMEAATNDPTQTSLIFEPDTAQAADTTITAVLCSANKGESDFFPYDAAPSATVTLTKDTGNPSGESGLTVLTNADDATIPPGYIVVQFNRPTSNFLSVFEVDAWLSASLPAQGPYKAERDAHAEEIIEGPYSCVVTPGSKTITIAGRGASALVLGKVLILFTNDATPDSDLEGMVVGSDSGDQGAGFINVTLPFSKSGTYTGYVIIPWWDRSVTTNAQLWAFPQNQLGSSNQLVWRTPPIACPIGTWFLTVGTANPFGVGTRLTSAAFTVSVLDLSPAPLVDATTISVDCSAGGYFSLTLTGNHTLGNPIGAVHGQPILFIIKQDGTGGHSLALGTAYAFGATVQLSDYVLATSANAVNYLACIWDDLVAQANVVAFVAGY